MRCKKKNNGRKPSQKPFISKKTKNRIILKFTKQRMLPSGIDWYLSLKTWKIIGQKQPDNVATENPAEY